MCCRLQALHGDVYDDGHQRFCVEFCVVVEGERALREGGWYDEAGLVLLRGKGYEWFGRQGNMRPRDAR